MSLGWVLGGFRADWAPGILAVLGAHGRRNWAGDVHASGWGGLVTGQAGALLVVPVAQKEGAAACEAVGTIAGALLVWH